MNFGCIIDDAVKVWPNKEALIYGKDRITYSELDARINRVARGLKKLEIGVGDHVAVLVKNDHRFVETMLGALRTGASVTPATTRAHYTTLMHIMDDCGARVLFASGDFENEAARLGRDVEGLEHVILMDAEVEGTTDYDPWLMAQSSDRFVEAVAEEAIASISYTSGSTGKPKGVLLTHAAMVWSTRNLRRALLFGPDERCLLAVPMFHANGMFAGLFSMLESGGSTVILHDVDPVEMIEVIAKERCTYTTGVPAMYKLMLMEEQALEVNDCSSLNFVICGSSEVPEDLLSKFSDRMAPMLEAYGLTECGFVCNTPRWGIIKQGTTGLPYPDVELRIVDPASPRQDVLQGEKGELLVRSPGNLVGYHNLPDVTAQRLLPGGWLRTSDIARADEQGYIEIIGREDDRIACAGEVFYPKEVENVLMEHENIADVAVVPRSDAVKGEVPVAFVVERVSGGTTPEELKSYYFENGAPYMHPRTVSIMTELPLTSAKKVDRAALREMAEMVQSG
ncbi:MAG: class I adenylate-forming enzyme family protein [Pseudomonadota bacterium]|nr:class I adenylate-forming enzyme family protein [Pseudomonadota bacterium]